MTVVADTQLVYLQPHMHLRGKDYEVRLIFPSGKSKTIFKAKWDFNWQLGFDLEKPIPIAEGNPHRRDRPFRQFIGEQVQPRSDQAGAAGVRRTGTRCRTAFMSFLVDPKIKDPSKLFQDTGVAKLPKGAIPGPTLDALRATLSSN